MAEKKSRLKDETPNPRPPSETAGNRHTTLEACKAALIKANGFVGLAAKALGISHGALSQRCKAHPELQQVRQDIDEQFLDMAEGKLWQAVQGGQAWAICFALKCKGKRRGYVERQEVDMQVEAKQPLVIQGPDAD